MADTFGKRQRAQRKKERKRNKQERKQERASGNKPAPTEEEIVRDLFDGIDPNARQEEDERQQGRGDSGAG